MKKIEIEGKSYDWCKNALARFRNVDQTSIQLAPAEKRTVEKKGEKQVRIIGPPEVHRKTCFTLTLTVNADGAKYPAIVVFKTSSKTGKIPSHVLRRYQDWKCPNPSKTQFVHWVSEAWNEVTTECVKAGFNEACWKHISDEN